jgi:hypothetical protein
MWETLSDEINYFDLDQKQIDCCNNKFRNFASLLTTAIGPHKKNNKNDDRKIGSVFNPSIRINSHPLKQAMNHRTFCLPIGLNPCKQ